LACDALEVRWKGYPRPAGDEQVSLGDALRAQKFLRIIKQRINPHLKAREHREANYEDLYAAVRQIVQDETLEIVNPSIAADVAAIKAASIPLHEGQEHHIDRNAFASLADRASDLVQWAVYFGLARATKPVGMDLISAVGHAVCELDIFPSITNSSSNGSLRAVGCSFSMGLANAVAMSESLAAIGAAMMKSLDCSSCTARPTGMGSASRTGTGSPSSMGMWITQRMKREGGWTRCP
jgi:hypothetical protein